MHQPTRLSSPGVLSSAKLPFLLRLLLVVAALGLSANAQAAAKVRLGIDELLDHHSHLVAGKRVGLVTNTSAVDSAGVMTLQRLRADGRVRLVQLYAPEHGLWLTGANGVSDKDGHDPATGIRVEGLNSFRAPSAASLKRIDVIVFDIQDIGSRTFTYVTTLGKVLKAAGKAGVPVVVLDRPNPRGGLQFEGPIIAPAHRSVVGWGPTPVTHGLTVGELARLFNAELGLKAKLQVVPMVGWRREMVWDDTGLRWEAPATAVTRTRHAHLYVAAGMVWGAGIGADDCVGANRFFECIATPYADPDALTAAMRAAGLSGVEFTPIRYRGEWGPTAGKRFAGVHLRVTDPRQFQPLRVALTALVALRRLYPKHFRVSNTTRFLRIWGSKPVLTALQAGKPVAEIEALWRADTTAFAATRAKYLLY